MSRFGIRAYDYRQGYTIAQIELMAADQPIVNYKNDKEKKPTKKDMDALYEKWEGGSKVLEGGRISLTEYMRKK